jgi:hypothetical protein
VRCREAGDKDRLVLFLLSADLEDVKSIVLQILIWSDPDLRIRIIWFSKMTLFPLPLIV